MVKMTAARLRFRLWAVTFVLVAGAARADVSELWGESGERWTPASRLPDFSYAGYRAGEKPIPEMPVRTNVKDFGAAGDGLADDTAAFVQAIQQTQEGAVLIPAGRYKITRMLKIRKRGIVLRGEGVDKTALFFPKPLSEAAGPGKGHAPGGSWSWSGGFISFEGWDNGAVLAEATAPAQRGHKRITVSTTSTLMTGQWVRLVMTDPDGSLARHLHADQQEGSKNYHGRKLVDLASPIESIAGNILTLKRPLRADARPAWKPAIHAFNPSVQEVGVEDLTLEFPETLYAGHHDEPGYNAISFEGVANGWARRLRILNADSGVFLRGQTKFCTVESIRFSATPKRLRTGYDHTSAMPVGGHHGVLVMDAAQDNLVSDFQFDFRFIHDLSISAWASGNVFSKGRGVDMDFDHHRRAPYENLFTEIQAGEGSRLWQSGGDESDGPRSGARETFWNIQTDRPQAPPGWAIQGNFIGVTTKTPSRLSKDGNWWEAIAPDYLVPANLYTAQRARR